MTIDDRAAAGNLTSLAYLNDRGLSIDRSTWAFDAAGRMTSSTSNDGTASYTYDAASQLTGETYSYQTNQTHACDATGNQISRTALASGAASLYTYDDRNRLTQVPLRN